MLDLLYVLLSAAVFGLDQAGKRESREKYRKRYRESADSGQGDRENRPHCHQSEGPVAFRYLENRGAMMNFGDRHSVAIRVVSVALTAILTVVYVLTLGHAGKNLLKTGLSLLLGGAFSNTYDRLKDGYVTDYLSFRVGPKALQKVVFNLGDFAIIIGALMVVLGS